MKDAGCYQLGHGIGYTKGADKQYLMEAPASQYEKRRGGMVESYSEWAF